MYLGGVEVQDSDLVIPASHDLTPVEKVDATCIGTGKLAHDHCSVCNKDFIDGVEKSDADLTIAATGEHVYDDENDMTCNTPGCTNDRTPEGTTPDDPEWTPPVK